VFKWLAVSAAVAVFLLIGLLLLVSAGPAASQASTGPGGGPSVLALSDIPPAYLALYMGAAQTCPDLPWGVLAGIGKVESDHGRSDAPGVHSGANHAGAEGPMQFEPATFAQYAVGADHDGKPDVYDPADAIYTAAAMLCANGAASGTPAGIRQAVFAYNHSLAYVTDVLSWAARYTVSAPAGAAAAAISFALAQAGKPYQWGAAGPDAYDCSGLVYAAYAAAGIDAAHDMADGAVLAPGIQSLQADQHAPGVLGGQPGLILLQHGHAGLAQLGPVLLLQETRLIAWVEIPREPDLGTGLDPQRLDELGDQPGAVICHLAHPPRRSSLLPPGEGPSIVVVFLPGQAPDGCPLPAGSHSGRWYVTTCRPIRPRSLLK